MLKQLREKRAKLVAEMRGIIETAEGEDRDLTAEEQETFDAAKASKDDLDKRIERLENVEASEAALDAIVPAASRRAGIQRPGGDPAPREFESIGEFLSAVRFNQNDQRLSFVEGVGAETDENGLRSEMRMDNDTQGGFMVPTQFRSTIMSVSPQDALVRPRASVIPAGSPPDAGITMPALDQSGDNPGNVFGGMTFAWIEEGGEKPETDAELRGISLVPHEIAGFVTVTDKLLRNWQASASFLENLMRGGVSAAEDYAFLRGTGKGQPLGALNAPVLKGVNRVTANQVTYTDLVNMVAVLLMRGGSPVWSIPQGALPQIAKLKDENGNYIWIANARDGFAGTLLGYPVRWNNRAPALGSKGDILLADWSYYLIKDGSGPFVAASEHVKFTSNKTVIKIFWNVDGAPWMHAPFKEENGYEVSPFVALDVPG
ncbi:HK97 family phage major capsid protein [Aquamicrobium lusatiense]|uniref:HK97 family phage major capsid protein n=1 Tax=Aquamicrobium lusatiense TaxID=89772 RepID=A0A7W9VTK9_9HYPH|nr:phage major capsid protein [Aquamicrobium lusatiense]MBB6011884.1 HK97 family phage major capsid protein [Aquamicrobium lusatiense]